MYSSFSPVNTLYNLNGVPWFTYGMIGITTLTLACVTMMDDSNKSFAKDQGFAATLTSSISSIPNPFSNMVGSNKEEQQEQQEQEQEQEQQQEPNSVTDTFERKNGGKTHRKTKSNIKKYHHNTSKSKSKK